MALGALFGKKDKSSETKSDAGQATPGKISLEAAKRFLPIRLLPERVIAYLVDRSTTTSHAKGSVLFRPGHQFDDAIYLLHGTIGFVHEGKVETTLSATDTKSNFPLSCGDDCTEEAVAVETVVLLHVPTDLIKAAQELSNIGNKPTGFSLHDDDDSPEHAIYLQLLEKAKNNDIELPSLPDIAIRIGKAIDNINTGSNDIARIIQMDPALTARIIHVVNSPLYVGRDPIKNCPEAVTRLGRETTRNLVISFLLKNLFRSKSAVLQQMMNDVWRFSTRVGAICHVLARLTPGLDPDRAMLAGLIHNIGAVAIINEAKHHPELANDPKVLYSAIQHLAPEIGSIIMRHWNFGSDLAGVVSNASDWLRDDNAKPDYLDLVLVARLHAFVGTPRIRMLPRIDLIPAFHKLALGKLTPQLSVGILDKAETDIKAVQQLLNA